ncbi:hypothetical protein FS827_19705 [Agrobacterium vitis]|uniref:hypothetical protein n=3 Tax=Rhizobiaceae TaxID=82115 RepID=UPI001F348727|nr:hypothetical protein [Allorhizobium ampelinum]MCF1448571.1 hypothetical protein [Allorhizobium ampelinum]MCF1463533.1 hypothetical protein [Allorhizobium ampelinum]
MSDRLRSFFDRPESYYPVAFRKAMSDTLLKPVPLSPSPYPKPDPIGALPDAEHRTTKQEDEFKHVHHKDVLGAGEASSDAGRTKDDSSPWKPVLHGDNCPSGCHVGYQKSTDRYSSFFQEKPKLFSDNDLNSREDLKKLVEYASKRDVNETLAAPSGNKKEEKKESEWSLFSKKENEVKTNAAPGSDPLKKDKTVEQGIKYKPDEFNKKYEVKSEKDEEGIHQYELNVFGAKSEAEFTAGRIKTEDSDLYGVKSSVGGKAGLLDWDNKLKGGQNGIAPREAGIRIKAVEISGKAEGQATIDFKKGEAATSGKLAANMTLLEGTGSVKGCFIPARPIKRACDSNHMNWAFPEELCKAVEHDDYDWGICLGGEASASVGVGYSAEGEAKVGKSGVKVKGSLGGQAGLGGKLGVEGSVEKFNRK